MCIETSYSLICTGCRTSFFEPGTRSVHFESKQDVIDIANQTAWVIGVVVPNGSKWDFCPRCFTAYEESQINNQPKVSGDYE